MQVQGLVGSEIPEAATVEDTYTSYEGGNFMQQDHIELIPRTGRSSEMDHEAEGIMDEKVYKAAAQGDIQFLKTRSESKIEQFRSPAKNTILHLYIIAQSTRESLLLQSIFKSIEKYVCAALFLQWGRYLCSLHSAHLKEQTVVSMLDMCPSLLWEVNETGDTPLHMAARHGQDDIVKVLLDRARSSSSREDAESASEQEERRMLHATNANGETALHQAVRYQHSEVVKVIISKDDAEFGYSSNADGETPLYMAAERGNNELVRMILEGYASPANQGPLGSTAFHAAVLHSTTKTPETGSYSPTIFSFLYFPLIYVLSNRVKFSNLEDGPNVSTAAEAIMKRNGLELFKQIDDRGRCPLHYEPSLLRCDKSAAFIADNDGNTALHIVASKGDSSSVKMFIKECPQCFEVVDRQGRNALHLAMQNGDKDTVYLILKSGFLCDLLKMKDNNGNTPLHLLNTTNYFIHDFVIDDPRFDKMAFNKDNLNPLDVILKSNFIHSNEKANLKHLMMDSAGIYPGRRVIADTCEESDGEERKEERQNHLVVAALIATVTFAAGFTMPGGYIQEKGPELGFVILSKNVAFRAFVISDALAMAFSSSAVFIHLLLVMDKEKQKVSGLFDLALPLTLLAIVAMVIAFVTGTYAVLAHSPSLAISASVVGCLFFYISFVCLKHVEWLPLPVLRFLAEKHL